MIAVLLYVLLTGATLDSYPHLLTDFLDSLCRALHTSKQATHIKRGGVVGRRGLGVGGWQMHTSVYRMDEQQGPSV